MTPANRRPSDPPITRRRVIAGSAIAPLALTGAAPAAEPAARAASLRPLRVLSYNIHYGQGMDGRYDVPRIAEVITTLAPDLVALQECDVGVRRSGRVNEVVELGRLTGLAARFGPTQHFEGGLFGNAVLSRLPIRDVRIDPLPYTEATADLVTYPRGAIAVTVALADGTPLRFVSTHFQHNLADDRLAEARAINALFAADDDTTPTILAGDINATPDSAPVAELLTRWRNVTEDPPLPTVPVGMPTARIDYVFVRPAARFTVLETRVIAETMASDHRPVFAVVEPLAADG
jgi:endonuclease/exonuclease/phosphatase family metal-dependent hydrolase